MKKRFLVTSILMLLLTVFALSTSTYAWFSMNTDVKVTGMSVIAKTDDTYLIISKTEGITTAAQIQNENNKKGFITVDMEMEPESSAVLASAPCWSDGEAAYLTQGTEQNQHKDLDGNLIATAGVKIDNDVKAAAFTNWYTAKAVDASESTIDTTTVRQLTEDDFAKYVIKKTVYLTVAKGANPAYRLTVSGTFTKVDANEEDLSACKVLIATKNKETGHSVTAILSSENLNAHLYLADEDVITDATVVQVDMYIYYDGNDENVYTNNVAKLAGATFNLNFGVTAVPQE